MGVVRRMGDWRLEKREEGVYEITFRRDTNQRVLTPDAPPYERTAFASVPVTEVGAYAEVEGLFEERAQGPSPLGQEYSSEERRRDGEGEVPLTELPAGLLGGVFVVVGVILLYTFVGSGNMLLLALAGTFGVIGLVPFVYAGYVGRDTGWRGTLTLLGTPAGDLMGWGIERDSNSNSDTEATTEKTPPPPERLKNELFFERANRRCEWCESRFDQPHVHHITPRHEGGSNDPTNLIVLCPNCHSKADRGAISRSKLRYRVQEQRGQSQVR